ncbi:FUSC family protein [Jeongeupia naejangsanensis]|uniref:FUSC family protein n=1 Tax=Jeongeupia naejangsanensis TaxID=613195 RepID=A0ABS2BQS3_9NEIS|nr:FUSC family protein [Jeongeupia naejangsanensis]MBM3117321.1 FUSC family protein [Jeongeupia naejangsanensis]
MTLRDRLSRLSISQEGRFVKLLIALLLGYGLPTLFNAKPYIAETMASSAWLALGLGPSIETSKKYFIQRSMANLVPIPIGLALYPLVPEPMAIIVLVAIVMFVLVKRFPDAFRLTSMGIAICLVAGFGRDLAAAEGRMFAVAVGMAIGFLVELLVLPPDQGYRFHQLAHRGSTQLAALFEAVVATRSLASLTPACLDPLTQSQLETRAQLANFKADYGPRGRRHLRRYGGERGLFEHRLALIDSGTGLLRKLGDSRGLFELLEPSFRDHVFAHLAQIHEVHRQLAAYFEHRRTEPPAHPYLDTPYTPADSANPYNMVLQGALMEHQRLLVKSVDAIRALATAPAGSPAAPQH